MNFESPQDEASETSHSSLRDLKRRRPVVRALLSLMVLVNLATSLYQLPLTRVIERRLCLDYYANLGPSSLGHDGDIREEDCKMDSLQQELGRIQGVMETTWIVGGEIFRNPLTIMEY
jgi:hypothetical protein